MNKCEYIIYNFTLSLILTTNLDFVVHQKKEVPTMEQIQMLRANQEVYSIFMDLFVSCMPGKDIYRRSSTKQPLSIVVTATDEAMAILVLKNNYRLWTEMAEKMKMGDTNIKLENCISKQLFFDERKGRGRSWSDQGKLFFNEVYKMIINDRMKNGDKFDEEYLQNIKLKNKTVSSKSKSISNEKIECMSDFSVGGMFSNTFLSNDNDNKNETMLDEDSKPASSNIVSI